MLSASTARQKPATPRRGERTRPMIAKASRARYNVPVTATTQADQSHVVGYGRNHCPAFAAKRRAAAKAGQWLRPYPTTWLWSAWVVAVTGTLYLALDAFAIIGLVRSPRRG